VPEHFSGTTSSGVVSGGEGCEWKKTNWLSSQQLLRSKTV